MGEAKRRMKYIDAWCDRMATRYGPKLEDRGGKLWNWRAALHREANDDGLVTEPRSLPTQLELEVAKAWEAGFWPKWAPKPKTRLILPGDAG